MAMAIAGSFISYSSCSQSNSDLPTLCKSDEFPYLNAKMQKIEYNYNKLLNWVYKLIKTEKVLSLCADKNEEPFGKFVYRYGTIGNVEMEYVASKTHKISTSFLMPVPHVGEIVFFFSNGKYNYYVTQATGQGSGIALIVFKSGNKILDLFSGNNFGSDYETYMTEELSSPVFRNAVPIDDLE